MPFTSSQQGDWSGGIFRQRNAPPGGAYDAVNFLINDDQRFYRRGGTAYKSNADAGDALVGLFDGYLAPGLRTLAWTASGASRLAYTLDSDDVTPIGLVGDVTPIAPFARGAVAQGILMIPATSGVPFMWGGSRKTAANETTDGFGLTNGSPTMTGSGTSWTSKYEAGSIVQLPGMQTTVVSVDSDTSITLATPWTGDTGSESGSILNFVIPSPADPTPRFVATTGTPARTWHIVGARAYYSDRGAPVVEYGENYIEIPASSVIVGADGFQDELILPTTEGFWTVANTSFDPVDDSGNIQWVQQQINRDLILWGDPGVSAYQGRLIVPAIDDIYMFSPGAAPESITQWTIRGLYHDYVKAGYSPGRASTSHGHYFLPIVDGTDVVDVLVARLDRPHMLSARPRIFPWTRLSGHAANGAYAARATRSAQGPFLYGTSGERIIDLTGAFDPSSSNAADADGTAHTAQLVTNDMPLGAQQPGFADRLRLTYEMTGTRLAASDDFNVSDGVLTTNYGTDPFDEGASIDEAQVISEQVAPSSSTENSKVWRSDQAFSGNMHNEIEIAALPFETGDTGVFTALGFVQDPGTGTASGYEARIRYDGTAAIFRWDNATRTRISDSVPWAVPVTAGALFTFDIGAGQLSAKINGAEVASVQDSTYFDGAGTAYATFGLNDVALPVPGPHRVDNWAASSGPSVTVEYSSDEDAGAFTALIESGLQAGGSAGGLSDGSKYSWWNVKRKRQKMRYRITVTGAAWTFVLRTLEQFYRPQNRQ